MKSMDFSMKDNSQKETFWCIANFVGFKWQEVVGRSVE